MSAEIIKFPAAAFPPGRVPPQRCKPADHGRREAFNDAVAMLAHVRTVPKEGRCFWEIPCVGKGAGESGTAGESHLYAVDCAYGASLAHQFVATLDRYADSGIAYDLLSCTLRDMVKKGRLSGVEIGFLGGLSRYFIAGQGGVA